MMAPSSRLSVSSTSAVRSMSVTRPVPLQSGHMPPVRWKWVTSFFAPAFSTWMAPCALTEGTLKE